jgi:hypothetical protein
LRAEKDPVVIGFEYLRRAVSQFGFVDPQQLWPAPDLNLAARASERLFASLPSRHDWPALGRAAQGSDM